jgi:transposase
MQAVGVVTWALPHNPGRPPPTELAARKTTTVRPTPATGVILALDLGTYKSVACRYAPDSGAVQFRTVPTDRDEFRRLIDRQRPALVVIEACTPAGWVHDLCGQLGVPSRVAPRGHRAWTELGRAGLVQLARPLADCAPEDLWRGLLELALTELTQIEGLIARSAAKLDILARADPATQLLLTVPGLGPRTAEAIAAHLDSPGRFTRGKQVSAYAGMVPRQYQTGESDRKGRITKRGPAILRKLLVQCAWAMLRDNDWARATWQRLTRGGTTRRKPAIVAIARRLLVRCWAMLRDGTPWRGDGEPQPQAAPA